MKKLILCTALSSLIISGCGDKTPKLGKDSIDDVIAAMTLEEKAHLVIGTGMAGFSNGDSAVVGETQAIVPGAAGTTYPIERLGIPAIVLADGPAGLRINPTREGDSATYYCTHFPIGTLLACTWDTTLVSKVGAAIGDEVLEYGVDVLLAPAMNIHRNPLCGRNFEYYSEDPLVAGRIAAAYVRGVQSKGVGTSVKHFAANNQETNRMGNDAQISPRAIREIYLKGFQTTVDESDPWTIMSSYNRLNGTYTSESEELLQTLLRDEWGYKGMVMTDWFGGSDAVAQMKAGNDMLQPGLPAQYEAIVAGVKDGTLDEAVLDRNVRRILELIMRTPRFKGYVAGNKPNLEEHAKVTRTCAADGMVLLKNDASTLPLSKDNKKVALYGTTSYDWVPGGTGSGNVNRAYTVSLLDGLKNSGLELVDPALEEKYTQHIKAEKEKYLAQGNQMTPFIAAPPVEEINFSAAELNSHATDADVAIITIGRNSGEFIDRTTSDFTLSPANRKLISDVTKAFHAKGKKVVVIMNVGGVIETASWKDQPDAILCAWQGGQEGGNSVADVLTGVSYPSGKLTMTFPNALADHASTANFPLDFEPEIRLGGNDDSDKEPVRTYHFTPYEEDVYVGYRYFDSFDKGVSYPFGYGLSYTEFEYGRPTVTEKDGKYTVSLDVKNIGKRPGREVVQLYAAAPDAKANNKPEKELRAFAKTAELQPGESETISMVFDGKNLASFNEESSEWVVAPGTYELLVGASSRDIRHKLAVDVEESHTPVHRLFTPKAQINTLKR
ncbi:MAG: glycoside hydrolase family 3 C-terminal domain-containing protein [Muribaculaceae bacterium]|nr:glycoside hydrolase family 3 C-terminal domain-containing protein [Muribaculaceae bacterium]